MNCSEWEREIAAESEAEGLAAHLQGCERCREFASELKANRAALAELTVHPAALAAVRRRVLDEIASRRRRAAWWNWSAVAAAACLAILCVSYLLPRFENPAAPAPRLAKMDPPKIEWTPKPRMQARARFTSSGRHVAKAAPARKAEPIVAVKMLTDDPNVIIIWLVDQKGDSL